MGTPHIRAVRRGVLNQSAAILRDLSMNRAADREYGGRFILSSLRADSAAGRPACCPQCGGQVQIPDAVNPFAEILTRDEIVHPIVVNRPPPLPLHAATDKRVRTSSPLLPWPLRCLLAGGFPEFFCQ